MTGISLAGASVRGHPLDVIEKMVRDNEWVFDRRSDEEMAVQVPGRWCDYSLYFAWNESADAMLFTCAFDMRVAAERRNTLFELVALVNDKMWLGHFTVWAEEGVPMFRHAMPLRGTVGPSSEQIEDLMETAIAECERFYPAFQYVIWAGKSAGDAVTDAMVDTVGEA